MKTLFTGIFSMLFIFFSQAQIQGTSPVKEPDYNKPKMFADLPDVMELKITDLELLIDLPMGGSISSVIIDGFPMKGIVVSKSGDATSVVRSVVIRLINRPGSTFCISQVKTDNGQTKFIGRVISMNNSDAFEIAMLDDKYVLRKKHLYDLVNE
jgi:hypothetical protein